MSAIPAPSGGWARRIRAYARLTRLDKPIGTLLLLWPTLIALWIACGGPPPPGLLAIFVLGTVLMRSAGCAVNDHADREFDPRVTRTRLRPLATGEIAPREALAVAAVLSLAAYALVAGLNGLTRELSVAAVLVAASYPYTKRFLPLPQAYLGIAFGFGIPMAFAAATGQVPALAWGLLAGNIFWAIAYDTEYAMVDRADDVHLGIHSSALLFGSRDVPAVMVCYATTLAIFAAVGLHLGRGPAWFAGIATAALIAGYHYSLIRSRDPARCFQAFRHNNWFGAALFAGVALDYGW